MPSKHPTKRTSTPRASNPAPTWSPVGPSLRDDALQQLQLFINGAATDHYLALSDVGVRAIFTDPQNVPALTTLAFLTMLHTAILREDRFSILQLVDTYEPLYAEGLAKDGFPGASLLGELSDYAPATVQYINSLR